MSLRGKYSTLFVLPAIITVATIVSGQNAPKPAAKDKHVIAAERLKAVKKTYELLFEPSRKGLSRIPAPESVYLWSSRWLESELDAAETAEARQAAYRGHLERMKEQDDRYRKLHAEVGMPPLQRTAAEFFRLEAEFWAARESSE